MTLHNLDQIVYLAAPYSIGNKEANVKRAISTANTLMDMGYYVYNPLLSHYQDTEKGRPDDYWYRCQMLFLERCDLLVWLDGESKGVLAEIDRARTIGMTVIPFTEFLQ